jgi:ribonuclease R
VARVRREELELRLDDTVPGGVRVVARTRRPVESWNEQLSLMVNVVGARLLAGGLGLERVQPIFRVHPPPAPEDLEALARRLAALARARGLDPDRWAWRPAARPLADFLDALPRGGRTARLVRAIERQAARVQRPSRYSGEPGPHSGVGAPVYARLTAPMREVVGVFTHKEMLELLGAERPCPPAADLALRERVVEAGNRAREVQRRLDKGAARIALDRWLAARSGADGPVEATVLGFADDRIYAQLDGPRLDIKVYLADQSGRWRVGPLAIEAVSGPRAVRLGDRVRLDVAGLDRVRDRWRLVLLEG